jgi:hypothetical protein
MKSKSDGMWEFYFSNYKQSMTRESDKFNS